MFASFWESELEISLASMFTEATSLTIVPTFMLDLFSRRCFRVEVLPDPRNPARRIIGIGFLSSLSVCGVALRWVENDGRDEVEEEEPLLEKAVAMMGLRTGAILCL